MKTITLEMPIVKNCMASECVYNSNSSCHARAITIGDSIHPDCDTYMAGSRHAKSVNQVAGIGACKTVGCRYNSDLECMAESIQVGVVKNKANCMTFDLC